MTTSVNHGRPIPGAIIGAFSGGTIGVVASLVPIFHWEMAGVFVIAFAAAAGALAAAVGAPRGALFGGVVSAVLFGPLFYAISRQATLPPENPNAIPTWGTVAVVVASFAAVAMSSLYSRAMITGRDSSGP